jgi:hypothetical protein
VPPVTELRITIIFASDNYHHNITQSKKYIHNYLNIMEQISFLIEKYLQKLQLFEFVTRVNIRIFEHPNPGFDTTVQHVKSNIKNSSCDSKQQSPYYSLSKSNLQREFNKRSDERCSSGNGNGNGKRRRLNIDSFRSSPLEPACVGQCKEVFVVLYHAREDHQPLHITVKPNTPMDCSDNKLTGLVIDNQVLVMVMNDVDFSDDGAVAAEHHTRTHVAVQKITSFIMNKFLKPVLFHTSILTHTHSYAKESLVSTTHLSDYDLSLLFVCRVIHFQRYIAQVWENIVSLEESEHYLRLMDDDPLLVLVDESVRAVESAAQCLESVSDMSGVERLQCAHTHLITAARLSEGVLNSPSMLSHTQEDYQFLLALVVPYWIPILIPVVFGTVVEIRRYLAKTGVVKSKSQ